MNLIKAGKAAVRLIKLHSPVILSVAAGAGLILLYVLTIKETEEAVHEIEEAPEEDTGKFKMAKKIVKIYAPSFFTLLITLFCIVQSTVISQHRIRDLTNYSAALALSFNQYRKLNTELDGKEQDQWIMHENAKEQMKDEALPDYDDGVLCMMPGYSHYFVVPSLLDIYSACSDANKYMDTGSGEVELVKWMQWAKAREYNERGEIIHMDTKYINYGWDTHDVTSEYAVSGLYPAISKVEDEEAGFEYYYIDIPMAKPLWTKWEYAI